MSAKERWSDTHDEPPPEVRELLEAGRAAVRARRARAFSPETRARMERELFAEVERREREHARAKWLRWGKRALVAAGALAAGTAAAFRLGGAAPAPDRAAPSRRMPAMEESAPASPVPIAPAAASASASASAGRKAPRP